MTRRSLVYLGLTLVILGMPIFALATPVSILAQETAREQKRLAKSDVLGPGLEWVLALQSESGGILVPNSDVDPRATARALSMMIALNNIGLESDISGPLAYVQQTDPNGWAESLFLTITSGEIAHIVLALAAAGGDPRDVGGVDLVAQLAETWKADAGIYGDYLFDTPLVVLALAAAQEPIEEQVFTTFAEKQLDDGSWNAGGETGAVSGNTWLTAYAVQALVATGRGDDPMVAKAVEFFRVLQGESGGFASEVGGTVDSESTGHVISALIAAGEKPKASEWGEAVPALIGFQEESGRFIRYLTLPDDCVECTTTALTALAGAYLPVVSIT